MRARGSRAGVAPFLLLALSLPACDATPSVAVEDWSLRVAGSAETVAVRLPAHLDRWLPRQPSRYTLTTEVTLPPEWRGRPLTLSVTIWPAIVQLRAGGVPAAPFEIWLNERYRRPHWQAWRLTPEMTRAGTVRLEFEAEHRAAHTGWIDAAPRLSANPGGHASYRMVRRFNEGTAMLCLGVLLVIVAIHLVSFVLDPRRRANFWFAAQAGASVVMPLYPLGAMQELLGTAEGVVVYASLPISAWLAVHFLHAHFSLGPPPRLFRLVPLAVAAVLLLGVDPFTEARRIYPAELGITMVCGTYCMSQYLRLLRRGVRRFDATVFLVSWVIILVVGLPDNSLYMGQGPLVYGLNGAPLGAVLFALLQALVVSRERVLALRDLEKQAREVHVLNEELRRQIGERSRELGEALARLESVGGPGIGLLASGTIVEDRYRVVSPLGAGAMGQVYEVERTTDGRHLALKVMRTAPEPVALARFAREAQVASQLSHPNLVSVMDVGITREGGLFLVMELVGGTTLRQSSSRYGDAAWALPILAQVAEGVAAMHRAAIVHRDLKPSNILLDGTVAKIADFGLSTLRADAFGDTLAPESADPGLTQTGVILGTPRYMAPELTHGARDAGPAADVYSLGVIAYELLTGKLPHDSPPVLERLTGRAPRPPQPIGQANPAMAPAVAALVDRCLAMEPASRPTAQELAAALGRR